MSQKKTIKFGKYSIPMPRSVFWRIVLGTLLCFGGLLWFLPLLGLWMIPLGLMVLSVDLAIARRWRRRMEVQGLPVARRWRAYFKAWWRKAAAR